MPNIVDILHVVKLEIEFMTGCLLRCGIMYCFATCCSGPCWLVRVRFSIIAIDGHNRTRYIVLWLKHFEMKDLKNQMAKAGNIIAPS